MQNQFCCFTNEYGIVTNRSGTEHGSLRGMVPGFLRPTVSREVKVTHAAKAAAPTANHEILFPTSGAIHPKKSTIGMSTST
jgi:hypothetical protein